MQITLDGMTILVKELHAKKAPSPILVTLFGMTISVKELQP